MENNKNLQDFYKSIIDINGQLLEMKINTAKGYLSEKDAQMMASILEQQLKQLLLANSKGLPQDAEYRNSLKGLKTELQSMAKNQVQVMDNIPEDTEYFDLSDDGSEFLPD